MAVVERSDETGGLMRGITRGEFSLDLGRNSCTRGFLRSMRCGLGYSGTTFVCIRTTSGF